MECESSARESLAASHPEHSGTWIGADAPQRFTALEAAEFNKSSEGRLMLVCLFMSSLFFMWPYQTMVQAQTFLSEKFPSAANSISPIMMVCTTLPLAVMHTLSILTGFGRSTFKLRIIIPCSVVIVSMLIMITLLKTQEDQTLLLTSMYVVALVTGACESIGEPSYFEIAGLLPSTYTSQAVMSGIGFAGVAVCGVQMLSRLMSNGLEKASQDSLQMLTYLFLGLTAATAFVQVLLYFGPMRHSKCYSKYVEVVEPSAASTSSDAVESGVNPTASGSVRSASEAVAAGTEMPSAEEEEMTPAAARRIAIGYVWPSVLCIYTCFGSTLVLWPSIPGGMCVSTDDGSSLKSWWFQLIVFAFNLGDLLGRLEPVSIKWGARVLSPMVQLGLSLLRTAIFTPLVLTAALPQLYDFHSARWVAITSIFFFAVSNGWLSTVCYTRAPKMLPPSLPSIVAEQASAVCALGMYWGLLSGSVVSYIITTTLEGSLGKCYGHA